VIFTRREHRAIANFLVRDEVQTKREAQTGTRGFWPFMSRREENHMAWEHVMPRGAIRAKGRSAVEESARRAGRTQRAEGHRNQRNNRREY
jgi:hypothetical protein